MNKGKPWALVTGANGGIGQALVKELVDNGYQVIATDIVNFENINRIESSKIVNIQLDLNRFVVDENYANNFSSKVDRFTHGHGIRVLINNAAIQILAPTEKLTRSDWSASLNVNLSAPFFMVQTFLSDLEKNRGAIVNISSIHATQTKKEFVAYATSKAALSSLTRILAVDLGSKVRVNAIEPAAVNTEMLREGFIGKDHDFKLLENFHPLGRISEPREIAELAVFLCSDKAKFVHGACVSASGGIQGCLSDPS